MAEGTWRYKVGEQEIGPVATEELCRKFASGELPLQTPVWSEAIDKWVAAGTIPGFRQLAPVPAQALDTPGVALDYYAASDDFASQPHPWIRFFARGMDATLVMMTLSVACAVIFRGRYPVPSLVIYAGLAVVSVFIEALLLSAWGTTPGKAFLGIKVETASGTKPTYSQALSRSFMVWLIGQGLYIPIVSIITELVAYGKLTSEGQTTWDRSTGLRVRHAPCGAGRVIGGIFLAVGYSMLLGIGTSVVLVAMQLRPMAARAALPPAPMAGLPTIPQNAGGGEITTDPRVAQLAGTWVIRATQNTNRGVTVWTNTLTLDRDGAFRQSIGASDAAGAVRPGSIQEWSGTWALLGTQFIQNVTESSTAQHPKGRFVYTLGEHNSGSFTLRRLSAPQSPAASDAHPTYTFRKSSAPVDH